jgi:hypothetical protein
MGKIGFERQARRTIEIRSFARGAPAWVAMVVGGVLPIAIFGERSTLERSRGHVRRVDEGQRIR